MPDRTRRGGGFLLLDLHFASRLAARLLETELERVGARVESAGLLTEIRTLEPVTSTELAQRTGLAEREPNPADRRSHLIRVTPAGLAQVRATSVAVRRAHERLTATLPRPVPEVAGAVTELRFALEAALNADAT